MSRPISRSFSIILFSALLFVPTFSQRTTVPNGPPAPPNGTSSSQSNGSSNTTNPYALPQDPQFSQHRNVQDQPSDAEIKLKKDHEKQMNKDRFEALKKDTEKLLALANELKTNVDKSTEDTLSMDVIKKSEEIEKLAKSVREKMIAN